MASRGKINRDAALTEIDRPVRIRKYKYVFMIVCEDENTEPKYFESFKDRIPEESIYLIPVGSGLDPLGVVKRAKTEKATFEETNRKTVDELWVVFDKDDADQNATKIKRFQDALELIASETFKTAFSNEVFEIWLLLHLKDVDPDTPLPRQEVYAQLQEAIRQHSDQENFTYEHGNESVLAAVAATGDEQAAFTRADVLIAANGDKEKLAANPITYVNQLVKALYAWIAYYSYEE